MGFQAKLEFKLWGAGNSTANKLNTPKLQTPLGPINAKSKVTYAKNYQCLERGQFWDISYEIKFQK